MSTLRPLSDTENQFQLLRCARKVVRAMRSRIHGMNTDTQFNALANEARAWDNMARHAHAVAADSEARRDDCLRRLTVLEQQRNAIEP